MISSNDDGTEANRDSPGPGPGPDILTYSLSGPDAKYFKITGNVDTVRTETYATSDPPDADDSGGTLEFKTTAELKAVGLADLDFETKRVFTVIITAADPSGDKKATVTVTVHLTDYNEMPEVGDRYESGHGGVRGGSHGRRSPVQGEGPRDNRQLRSRKGCCHRPGGRLPKLLIAAKFEIDPLNGTLSFKSSPNYEKPGDGTQGITLTDNTRDNKYKVVVSAENTDDNPGGPYTIYRKVTVVVADVNEAPKFADSTDTLEITENPDDPEKEPPAAHSYLYLLNRGVGKPAPNLPAAPNLDVGKPAAAADDDSTATFPVGGYAENPAVRDRIDGLTYTLSGTDAGYFHTVPATGQILTKVKLDYEAKKEYKVTVTATDTTPESEGGPLSASIDITIRVTDLDEQNVPKALLISGGDSHTVEENSTDAVGEYTVAAGGGASANPNWTLEGADAGNFMLEGTGNSRMLKFSSPPDFDTPMGGANDDANTYMVTIKVTDPSDSNVTDDHIVRVTVTDVDELGALSGDASISYAEDRTDAVGTYTISGANEAMATWTREGDDASHFMLDGSGASRMLKFSSSPNFEAPADANTDNIYMVTVKASYGGETEMVAVAVTVTDVEEEVEPSNVAPVFADATTTRSIAENTAAGTNIGAPVAATDSNSGDVLVYSLGGTDAASFGIDSSTGQLQTLAALDYEDETTYTVVVRATDPAGLYDTIEVTISVTDVVDEAVPVTPTDPVATYDTDGVEGISSAELSVAISEYIRGDLDPVGLSEVIAAYING